MLRIALVGAGRTVRIGHAPALQALHELYRVVAIADLSPDALEDTGILLGVSPDHRYTDYREMLAREAVDVISITLPHVFHHEVAMEALKAGAHVITERPIALSLPDAEEEVRFAEAQEKLIIPLHYFLYYPPFREAIRRVSAGEIGEPFFVRCEGVTGGYGAGTATYHPEWHADPEIAGGGVWLDSGYHNAYLCTALLGSHVSTVAARIATYNTGLPVDDTAVVLLVHENGSTSSVQVAWSVPSGGQRIFEIYGTKGTIALDHEGYSLGLYTNATQTWHHETVPAERGESFIDMYKAISDGLRFGAPPPVTHRDALHALEIVLAGYRASEHGAVESIKPRPHGEEQAERPAA